MKMKDDRRMKPRKVSSSKPSAEERSRHGGNTRDVLCPAVEGKGLRPGGLGTEIAGLFSEIGLDAAIPELRGHGISPVDFRRMIIRNR
jgi:hypothetical protein